MEIIRNLKTLFVDDEKIIRETFKSILDMYLDNITVAKSAKEAIELLSKNEYELLITDIRLGDMTGFDVGRIAKRKYKNIIVFLISSHIDAEYFREALDMHVMDYIPKPLKIKDIEIALNKCANKYSELISIVNLRTNIQYDMMRKAIIKNSFEIVELSPKEFMFIELILKSKNRVVTYEEIKKNIYNDIHTFDTNLVKNMVYRLNQKIGKNINLFHSISGYGYRLENV